MKLIDKRTAKRISHEDLVIGCVYEDSDGDILMLTEEGNLIVLVGTATAAVGCTYGDDAKKETFIEVKATLVLE